MDTGKPPRGRRSTMATSRGGAGDDDERLHASSTVRAGELDFGVSGEGAETKARNSASSRTSIRGSGRGATLGSGGWLLRLGEAGRAIPEHVCKNTRSVCVCAYMRVSHILCQRNPSAVLQSLLKPKGARGLLNPSRVNEDIRIQQVPSHTFVSYQALTSSKVNGEK